MKETLRSSLLPLLFSSVVGQITQRRELFLHTAETEKKQNTRALYLDNIYYENAGAYFSDVHFLHKN